MIVYFGRYGNYLGQASAVPPEAPLTRAPGPAVQVVPVVTPAPVVPAQSAVYQDLDKLNEKVNLTKAGIIVGSIVLVALTLTLSSSLLRRA